MTEVTQADRDAAEAWRRDYGRKGSYQDLLRAFAQHRINHTRPARATDTALAEELRALTANPPPNLDGMGLWLIRNQSRILAVLEGKRT